MIMKKKYIVEIGDRLVRYNEDGSIAEKYEIKNIYMERYLTGWKVVAKIVHNDIFEMTELMADIIDLFESRDFELLGPKEV